MHSFIVNPQIANLKKTAADSREAVAADSREEKMPSKKMRNKLFKN